METEETGKDKVRIKKRRLRGVAYTSSGKELETRSKYRIKTFRFKSELKMHDNAEILS